MEKLPVIKVVGNASDEEKTRIKENIEETYRKSWDILLTDEELAELLKGEKPKTPLDSEVIVLVNKVTNEFILSLGLDTFDLGEENVHILDEKTFIAVAGPVNAGYCSMAHRAIFLEDVPDLPVLLRVNAILHEALHFKCFEVQQVFDVYSRKHSKQLIYSGSFRHGLTVSENIKHITENELDYKSHFKGLNEAVVSEIEKKLLPQIISESKLVPKRPFGKIMTGMAEKIIGLPAGEVVFVDEKTISAHSYRAHRAVLSYVVDSIVEDNQDLTRDEVLTLFFKAHFSGHLLEIARLIEKSFGQGSFRLLGDMEEDKDSAVKIEKALFEKRLKTRSLTNFV